MRRLSLLALTAILAATTAAPAPALAKRVEVTRFHTAESLAALDGRPVAVVAAPGMDDSSLENRVWLTAVEQALAGAGFPTGTANPAQVKAEVRVEWRSWKPERERGGVSVGVGGSTGGYGSGVGLGIGINLGGGPAELTETTLSVTLRDELTGQSLWEGRAVQTVKASSKAADADVAADKLAKALFAGFPGRSGDTISVK
jgi:hypothetical protein